MRAELNKWRIALADRQREMVVLLADIEDIQKRFTEMKKAVMLEYEKIDAALDKDATDRGT